MPLSASTPLGPRNCAGSSGRYPPGISESVPTRYIGGNTSAPLHLSLKGVPPPAQVKHKISVERFYKTLSKRNYESELAVKYKNRVDKNRDKLFTFLDHDSVPWNNNNAEHAIKAFVRLRNVIGGTSSDKGIREYLTLLSICETCKYKGANFLDFLRSGEKDIDVFIK
jgi:hypothetical protein